MRKHFLIFCIFFSFSGLAQKTHSSVETVLKQMNAQEVAWNNGDLNGFMVHYWQSDSLKFIGSKGLTYGWQNTLNNYKKSYPGKEAMGTLTFNIREATMLCKNFIYVIGKWQLQKEKPSGGYFTLLWQNIDGKWVIIADHTS